MQLHTVFLLVFIISGTTLTAVKTVATFRNAKRPLLRFNFLASQLQRFLRGGFRLLLFQRDRQPLISPFNAVTIRVFKDDFKVRCSGDNLQPSAFSVLPDTTLFHFISVPYIRMISFVRELKRHTVVRFAGMAVAARLVTNRLISLSVFRLAALYLCRLFNNSSFSASIFSLSQFSFFKLMPKPVP